MRFNRAFFILVLIFGFFPREGFSQYVENHHSRYFKRHKIQKITYKEPCFACDGWYYSFYYDKKGRVTQYTDSLVVGTHIRLSKAWFDEEGRPVQFGQIKMDAIPKSDKMSLDTLLWVDNVSYEKGGLLKSFRKFQIPRYTISFWGDTVRYTSTITCLRNDSMFTYHNAETLDSCVDLTIFEVDTVRKGFLVKYFAFTADKKNIEFEGVSLYYYKRDWSPTRVECYGIEDTVIRDISKYPFEFPPTTGIWTSMECYFPFYIKKEKGYPVIEADQFNFPEAFLINRFLFLPFDDPNLIRQLKDNSSNTIIQYYN